MSSACIWLTRPQADSEALAATLMHQGIESIVSPIMRIEPRALTALPEKPDAILLTSRHASPMLAALPEEWRAIPVFCVGPATGSSARDAGYTEINQGATDVIDLLPALADSLLPNARILYLSGVDVKVDVTTLLAAKQLRVETLLAYEAVDETELMPELIAALDAGRVSGVVFFSPRSAKLAVLLLVGKSVAQVDAFCLSLAVAEAAGALPWRSLQACHAPTLEAMVNLVVSASAKVV